MSLQETLGVLKEMPLFKRVDQPRLRVIALMGENATLRAGERLAERGEPGDAAYVVIEGTVDVRIPTPAGEVSVASIGPGEIVGEMALLTDRPRSAAMVAATDLVLLRLDRPTLLSLLREFPDVALEMIRVLALRLEATTARSA
ncbi:MAG: cyclic nucleotide-binding domain-containing protein [Gemmobacter sp.]